MKKILVIGATSAIAEHCARIWATRGDALFLVARDAEKMRLIANDLEVRGALTVHISCLDLNEIDQHQSMLDEASKALGNLDIVLIAHGTLSNQKQCEKNVDTMMLEIKTNAISTLSMLTLIANRFEANKNGTIAVISSVAGDRGRASNYVYGCAKAMVTAFTSGLRQRLYSSNVTVLTIKPGFVDTPMTSEFKKGILWAKPHNVAKRIVIAIDQRKNMVYVPWFWSWIMGLIVLTPISLFNKLKLLIK